MLVKCPHSKCSDEVEQTIEAARHHVRWRHGNMTDRAKIILRDKICKFVETGGFGKGRTKYENFLSKQCGIK